MNKLKIGILSTIFAALAFTSCQKDFLEVKPFNQSSEEELFQNPERAQQLVNASYRSLLDADFLSGMTQQVNELWSDNVTVAANNGNYRYYNHQLGDIFNDAFNGSIMGGMGRICRDANAAIYGLNKYGATYGDKLPADKQKKIIAEAKFLRSLAHFETVRLFAQPYGFTADNSHYGISIRNDFSVEVVGRSTVAEVYAFLEKDLQEAIADLPATPATWGYASKNIAKGLLAKVYFQENKYQQAYDLANDLLTSSGIDADTVQNRFSKLIVNTGSLYLLTPQLNSNSALGNYRFQTIYAPGAGGAAPAMTINAETRQLMSYPADVRYKKWYKQLGSDFQLTKFPDVDYFNINYIHWAELKLMRAECAAELNNATQASQDLNDVRARAQIGQIITTDLAVLIRAIRSERRVEMVGEGNRMQDLKRIGAASRRSLTKATETVTVRNAPWDCPGMVLQIPSGEIAGSPNYPSNPAGSCN